MEGTKKGKRRKDYKPRNKKVSHAFVSCKLLQALFKCRPCWSCCILKDVHVGLEPKLPLSERPFNPLFSILVPIISILVKHYAVKGTMWFTWVCCFYISALVVVQHSWKKVVQSEVFRYGNYGAKGGEVCRACAERLPADQNSNPQVWATKSFWPPTSLSRLIGSSGRGLCDVLASASSPI